MYFSVWIALVCAGVACGQQDNGTDSQEPRMQLYCTNQDDRSIQGDQKMFQIVSGKAGPPGPVGKVNYTTVNGTIKNYVKEISRHELSNMRLAVEGNSEEIQNLTGASGQTQRQVTQLRPAVEKCTENIETLKAEIKELQRTFNLVGDLLWYDGKRYIALASSTDNVYKSTAKSKCRNMGGDLANIYNQVHMKKIMDYIRQNKLQGSSYKYFHLGMTYDPMGRILRLRDGTRAPIGDYKWYPGRPVNGSGYYSYTKMFIRISSSPTETYQYLYNRPDNNYYVLCEI